MTAFEYDRKNNFDVCLKISKRKNTTVSIATPNGISHSKRFVKQHEYLVGVSSNYFAVGKM